MTVRGSVAVEGRPVGGQDVLAMPPGGGPALAVARTDDTGAFALDVDGDVALLAKVRTDALGVAAGSAGAGDDAALVVEGPLASVSVRVESDVGFPDELDVFFTPEALAGVPAELMTFVTQREPGVYETRFVKRSVTEREWTVRLQAGVWRLGAEYVNLDRAHLARPDFLNYVTASASADGEALPGDRVEGFRLEVGGDRVVTLRLRELADSEL